MIKYCECGCGQEVKEENRFISGHNSRIPRTKYYGNCLCGCKKKISRTLKEKFDNDETFKDRFKTTSEYKKATLHEHFKHVCKEAKLMEKQGFRCVLTTIPGPIPDLIAIKDGKVYAVEIEMEHNKYHQPNYKKYTGINCFDDIYWIKKQSKFKRKEK